MKFLYPSLFLLVLAGFVILLSQPINLTTSDLGRHLRNGGLVLKDPAVLARNFYSYTYPDYPVINHHWGSGLIFWLVYKLGGFSGPSLLYIGLSLLTFIFFLSVGLRVGSLPSALVSSLIFLPLLVNRAEIRPEIFSYLLTAIFLFILVRATKWLFLLPILEILWVNLHIYFPLGIFLIAVFLLTAPKIERKKYLLLLLLTAAATLVNPAGLSGSLYPLTIFTNYGYSVLENQSFTKLASLGVYLPITTYFFFALTLLILSGILRPLGTDSLPWVILGATFASLALFEIRNLTFFGYIGMVILARNLKKLGTGPLLVAPVIALFLLVAKDRDLWLSRQFGLGLALGVERPAQFFLSHHLKGPIFNNYDIGGYLIYYLYPREKVFVDNRPEAYPADFFTQTYIPMQEGAAWNKIAKTYNFQTIFFAKTDLSPWSGLFLQQRRLDPAWQIVYEDENVIIFVKNSLISNFASKSRT